MKQRPIKFRVWHPGVKRMGIVKKIVFNDQGEVHHVVGLMDKALADFQGKDVILTESAGVQDDNKVEIYEEDLLDCIFLHPKTNYMTPMRARVIWNPYIHMGPIGFILIDQDGGMHPFSTIDSFVVVGNTFQGVTKTT